ncbi:MAG: CAP domain-containing protein [Candidatus Saccharibacteria bacterium]|nr:CAP domain-containing protein [Candidatus Saccharibacteria bacterium]
MKRAILITAILALVAGVGGGVWLKTQLDSQTATKAAQEQPQAQPSSSEVATSELADANKLLRLINEERKKVGVQPLISDEDVRMSAQLKADDMVAKGYWQHEIPDLGDMYTSEMRKLLYDNAGCVASGENIMHRSDGNDLVDNRGIVKSWMESEPHRKAILNPKYTKTGMAVNTKVAVQHFCVAKW